MNQFQLEVPQPDDTVTLSAPSTGPAVADPLRQLQERAIKKVQQDDGFWQPLNSGGIPWGVLIGLLKEALPSTLSDRDSLAATLVPTALTQILGPKDDAWTTERKGTKNTLFVKKLK